MIILGLGTNVGDRLDFLRRTLDRLQEITSPVRVRLISPIYESAALLPSGIPADQMAQWNQPFLNLAIACESQLEPDLLLNSLKSIEKEIGRKDRGRWAPREIDIDILACGHAEIHNERLRIPHPEIGSRPFALLPLADLILHFYGERGSPTGEPTAFPLSSWATVERAFSRAEQDLNPKLLQRVLTSYKAWYGRTSDQIPFQTRRARKTLTELVGVLNITPDSFSDGGRFLNVDHAIVQAEKLIECGATVLDLGAESTRPGACAIAPSEEWQRLEPVLSHLRERAKTAAIRVRLSLDTRNVQTARKALEYGVDWINDVSGLGTAEMRNLLSEFQATGVFMHSLTLPADPSTVLPRDEDPMDHLINWARQRLIECEASGLVRARLIFDPGIGFGTAAEQSWHILRNLSAFHGLGVRILVGHSRKSFLTLLTGRPAQERDLETAVLSGALAHQGVRYLRVHDLAINQRAIETAVFHNGVIRLEP